MEQALYQNYHNILRSELIPALGCTEPIAIAYAAAKAREVLGEFPDKILMKCSGNIIKNVMGVTVPKSGGMKGIEAAAVLGVVGGKAERELEVLEEVTPEDIAKTRALVRAGYCSCDLLENVENLYIVARVEKGEHNAEVTIINRHTFIKKIVKDGSILMEQEVNEEKTEHVDKSWMSVKGILEFADCVKIEDVRELLDNEIQLNTAIAEEGLKNPYGAQVGRILLRVYQNDVWIRARAKAAAGSDARMGGCSLPVVINSGSGNQGMTVSLPVIEYAKELKVSQDKLYRALVVSNLIAIHQKKYIGSLSAYCGAVSAACGAGAAITYLYDGTYDEVAATIVNTIANVGGIVCDGAKSSCAAKISSAVEAAINAHHMARHHCVFMPGEGIVQGDVEDTIKSVGYVGRVGMKSTDIEILNLMIDRVQI